MSNNSFNYQWEIQLSSKQRKKETFTPIMMHTVTDRDKNHKATKAKFNLLIKNPNIDIKIIGEFNKWGKKETKDHVFKYDNESGIASVEIPIKHKTPYLFLLGDKVLRDPSTVLFDDNLNSVFWDFEDPSCYKFKHTAINNLNRPNKILQTDLPGLIVHFADKKGNIGAAQEKSNYYKFIADSGIIDKIKSLGFNTIQFLPLAKSIDGDNWKFRYLSLFPYAIQEKWGNPDEFRYMIDKFHEKDIAVINDILLSHCVYRKFTINGVKAKELNLKHYLDKDSKDVLFDEITNWGTKRYRYDDPKVRTYLIESAIHFMKNYQIDGFRIDNVDGILRFGVNGDGNDRPGGRKFLREFNREVYKHNPKALISLESHYFAYGQAKLLVHPLDQDKRALGATAYSSSRIAYFFHTDYMPKAIDEISPITLRHIISEKEWGKCNSTIADFHNHDAASGLMDMRATGSYAYDAMILNNHHLHVHAVGKIKVMQSIIAFGMEGRILNLLQTFLMQTGTFEHDSSIKWFFEMTEANNALVNFLRKTHEIMNQEAFWPENTENRVYLNEDDTNKTLTIYRACSKEKFIVFINLGANLLMDYRIPSPESHEYELVFDSDKFEFCGSGRNNIPQFIKTQKSNNFKLIEHEIFIPFIAPYSTLIFKKK